MFRYLIAPPLTTVVPPEPTYTIAEEASILGRPCILLINIVLNALITPTLFGIVNLKSLPKLSVLLVSTVSTSPAEYPVPPIETVAATPILLLT